MAKCHQIHSCLKGGCSTNTSVINLFSVSVSHPFPPAALQRRQAQMVRDTSSSYKIEYVQLVKTYLNPEGHQYRITCLKVRAILLERQKHALNSRQL